MSLKPLNDRVLVKRLESEERTASGLYIPDTAKEKPSKGEVVAVGPGKHADDGKLVPMAVKVGDMVLFNKYAGTEVKIDGVEHLVMREDDILAIIAYATLLPLATQIIILILDSSGGYSHGFQRNSV